MPFGLSTLPKTALGHSRRLRHVRLRSGLGTIPDIFADDCRINLSALK
jgi:hypothetical protein